MSSFRQQDDFNPLRPYHFPRPAEPAPSASQNASTSSARASGSGSRPSASAVSRASSAAAAASSLGSSTRDILSDLDYSDYLNEASPSLTELVRNLFDQGLWKYTSILLAQPFDVAKMLLQVQLATAVQQRQAELKTGAARGKPKAAQPPLSRHGSRQHAYDVESDDSGDDSSSYFTSAAPLSPRTPTARRMQRPLISRSPSPEEVSSSTPSRSLRRPQPSRQPTANTPHTVALASTSSLTSAISYLWSTEGAWGVWKGTNATFLHNVLVSSFTTFIRSLLCALLALPDPSHPGTSPALSPGGLDILSSPSPLLSLLATTSASALAALLLSPLDIARTRLILTPVTHGPRSLVPALRAVGAWTVPRVLALPTLLHGALPAFVSAATPLVCRNRLGVDPVLTPAAYAVATFAGQAAELALRLPVETVLRRGQVRFAAEQEASAARARGARKEAELVTVVPTGDYRGLVGTMYAIAVEEGERDGMVEGKGEKREGAVARRRKGQGIDGLYRGWRVGAWGLLGVWGAAMLGGSGKGGEF